MNTIIDAFIAVFLASWNVLLESAPFVRFSLMILLPVISEEGARHLFSRRLQWACPFRSAVAEFCLQRRV